MQVEKKLFKNIYCNWNLQMQIDKVQQHKHIEV